jgi:hypothetical protein
MQEDEDRHQSMKPVVRIVVGMTVMVCAGYLAFRTWPIDFMDLPFGSLTKRMTLRAIGSSMLWFTALAGWILVTSAFQDSKKLRR